MIAQRDKLCELSSAQIVRVPCARSSTAEIAKQPPGTLVIDIGTNGELIYKGRQRLYATSCATGPAFEGGSLTCGMQAIPGAIKNGHVFTSTAKYVEEKREIPYLVREEKNARCLHPIDGKV